MIINRGVATGRKGGKGAMALPLQFPNQTRSNSFSSNIRDIAFYGCSEIIRTRNFTIFTVYITIFGQFTAAFYFFLLHRGNRSLHVGPSEKVRHVTLDLPKSFLLWTIRKKTTMNKSLTVKLQAESWTYCTSHLKQEKHPYKWSTVEYNCIDTGTSENVL